MQISGLSCRQPAQNAAQQTVMSCKPRAPARAHSVARAAVDSPAASIAASHMASTSAASPQLLHREDVTDMEASVLDVGHSVAALRRFNNALLRLKHASEPQRKAALRGALAEMAYNLESFNPIFTAVLMAVQNTVGLSNYAHRDNALKMLIQPLMGEYGMHSASPPGPTHRVLFQRFYESLTAEPLSELLAEQPLPPAGVSMFRKMKERLCLGQQAVWTATAETPNLKIDRAVYALGYNLAIEYLADYEKTWMLDSFRALAEADVIPRSLAWEFLEVHAEGEVEHAALGRLAVCAFVCKGQEGTLRQALLDHDADLAEYYNRVAAILEGAFSEQM